VCCGQVGGCCFLNAIEILRDPSHVRDHRVSEWLGLCAAAGFEPLLLNQWPLRLEFGNWVARMRTPAAAVAQIRALMDGAAAEVRTALTLEADGSFSAPVALISAVRTTG
jgi:hypothetical protein